MPQLVRSRHASITVPELPRSTARESPASDNTWRTWEATLNELVLIVLGAESDERLLLWLRRVLGGPPADLFLLNVRPSPGGVVAGERHIVYAHQAEDAIRAQTLVVMSMPASRLRDEGFRVVTDVRFGEPGPTVLRTADELRVGLIVLGMRESRDWRWWRRGRAEQEILRRATVPVLAVRHDGQGAV